MWRLSGFLLDLESCSSGLFGREFGYRLLLAETALVRLGRLKHITHCLCFKHFLIGSFGCKTCHSSDFLEFFGDLLYVVLSFKKLGSLHEGNLSHYDNFFDEEFYQIFLKNVVIIRNFFLPTLHFFGSSGRSILRVNFACCVEIKFLPLKYFSRAIKGAVIWVSSSRCIWELGNRPEKSLVLYMDPHMLLP